MNTVRLGIIGMGNIGKHHAEYLRAGAVGRCKLTTVCGRSPEKLEKFKPLRIYDDGEKLIRSGDVDAVLIATPHFQHTTLGIAALEQGLHVMVEKPISAHKADAERLIAAHQRAWGGMLVFAGMFQLRVEPRYARIRELIQTGELGEIARVSWIITDWYRTEAYYRSGGWRATWGGEGGGVLLNQCLHNLDTLQWLCGMPKRARGFCQLGRYHDIEVEDNVTAYLEYPNGATGVFITSTGEAPGTNRLEIVGARGRVVLENDRLTFARNEVSMTEFSRTLQVGFMKPPVQTVEIPFENAAAPHATVMRNFVAAILDGKSLIAPGAEGLNSVELANAILFSSLTGQTVEFPLDGAAYEKKLAELTAGSTVRKNVVEISTEDFARSLADSTSMYLTGIADEAGAPIEAQIRATQTLGWRFIEARSVRAPGFPAGNIHDIPDAAFDLVVEKLEEAGIRVSGFGSTIANWAKPIDQPGDTSLAEARRAVPRMQRLGAKLVRVMSYALRDEEEQFEEERFCRLRDITKLFLDAGIQPVHENDANYGGLGWRYSLRLLENVPGLKLLYDTGNPVMNADRSKPKPWPQLDPWEFYSHVREHIAHVHVKDGVWVPEKNRGNYTFPGEGNGQVRRVLKDLLANGYDAGLAIEPHMAVVFHNQKITSTPEAQFENYVEYGRRMERLVNEVKAELAVAR